MSYVPNSTVLLHHFDGVQPSYGPEFEADGMPIFTASGALFSKAYDPNRAAYSDGCLKTKAPSSAFDLQGDFTIEYATLLRGGTTSPYVIVADYPPGGTLSTNGAYRFDYVLGLDPATRRLTFEYPTRYVVNASIVSSTQVSLGVYVRLAVQLRGNLYTLFADGQPVGSVTSSIRPAATRPKYLSVGRFGPYAYAAADALYAELRLSGCALYPETGYAIATGPFPDPVRS